MKLKNLKLLSLLCLVLFSVNLLQGCRPKDKEIVISEDVAQDIQLEESQVEAFFKEGEQYLKDNKFEEGRNAFQSAVEISNSDKEIYLRIKDQYLQLNRYDDAYYFINLAIKNNVDTENMNKLLMDIRSKMDTVKVTCEAYVNQVDFNLPDQVTVIVDGKEYTDYVVWNDWNKDISTPGNYTYHGITKEFGRNAEAQVKLQDLNENMMAFIRDTYIKDNEVFIVVDEVEFYTGEEAIAEAKKDMELPKDEDGNDFMPNGYYLRNTVEDSVTYKLSKDAAIEMCAFWIDLSDETTLLKSTDYETFKDHVDKYKADKVAERSLLFKVDINHGLGSSLSMQFTP